jgi:hypothetical protein
MAVEMTNIRGQNFSPKNHQIELLKKAVISTKESSEVIGTAFKSIEKNSKEGEK